MFLFVGSQDFSVLSLEEVVPVVQETSIKRLVVGPLDIRLHSSAVHRILKMITCAMDHEYEPYCKPQQGWRSHTSICPNHTLFSVLSKATFMLQVLMPNSDFFSETPFFCVVVHIVM